MGGLHVAVEVAARDVSRIMKFHKVHPQVQEELNRRMDSLRLLSVTNLQARDAAPKVPSEAVASWILEDIVHHVISSEIPKVQVAEAERKAANLQQALSATREALSEQQREVTFLQSRVKHMEEAKDYMMQSFFREVATLRQHNAELQASVLTLGGGGPPTRVAQAKTHSHDSQSPTRRNNKLKFPAAGGEAPADHATASTAVAHDDDGILSHSTSMTTKCITTPVAAHPPSELSTEITPTQEVDALFDYERYVSFTNEAITSWPERYDALQKRFADTVHHMQLASTSAALQNGKVISGLQKALIEKESRLVALSAFVQRFHPIVMQCVKNAKQQLAEQNNELRREVKSMQLDHVDTVIALSDRIYEVDKRMELFVTFIKYATEKLQHKMRLVQDGHRVRATQGKPLWQFFLLTGKDDDFAEAKAFWQEQALVKDVLESFKQSLLSLERISVTNFGPPSDDDEDKLVVSEEPVMQPIAKPVRTGPTAPEKPMTKTRGGRGGGGGRGRGRTSMSSPVPSPRGARTSRVPSVASQPPNSSATPTALALARSTSPESSSTPTTAPGTGQERSVSPGVDPNSSILNSTMGDGSLENSLRRQTSLTMSQMQGGKGGSHRDNSLTSSRSKGEEFVQHMVRRLLDAKMRRIMCKIRRRVFMNRLPVVVRNIIMRLQRLDDDIRSADAAVDRYEKRRANTEGKLKKELLHQSLSGGSLFSTFHQNKKVFGGGGKDAAAAVAQPPQNRRVSLASSSGSNPAATFAAIRRRSIEGGATKSPVDASTPSDRATGESTTGEGTHGRQPPDMDGSELQSFTAFTTANHMASSVNEDAVPSQHLQMATALSVDGLRGLTPLTPGEGAGCRSQRRVSDVSFHDLPVNDVPTAESRPPTRYVPPNPPSSTPLPLLLISTSPQPPPLAFSDAHSGRHPGRTLEPVSTPGRDAEFEEMDANVFRIRSLAAKTPNDHYIVLSSRSTTSTSARATPKGKTYAIPSMPSATSRSLSARSREVFTHELGIRVGSAMPVTPVDHASPQCLLPELRAAGGMFTPKPVVGQRSPR